MRPLDPRLLRHARSARGYVVLTGVLGLAGAGAVIGQAVALATVVAGVFRGRPVEVAALLAFGGLVAVRTGLGWVQERFGHRAATAVIGQLRDATLEHLAATEPFSPSGTPVASTTTLLTRGLDALDGYLTRYLPQLLLVLTVTPAVLAVIWWNDTIAGVTVLLTLPLVPLFMALVGLNTQALADRRLATLQRLGSQVLDLIAGLPTLRAFGRQDGQAGLVRETGDQHRRATMRTLASAFLSALVLETMTTLSVALVAVGVGLRLVNGGMDLRTGLLVLILAPEAYLPLRLVGVQHHASVEGLAACAQVFDILDRPLPARGREPAPDLRCTPIRLDGVSVVHPGSQRAAPAGLSATIEPGLITALVGPSGTGKSTAVAVLLGLREPTSGAVTAGGVPLGRIDLPGWWSQLAWVPQQPTLVPGTLAQNATLGCGEVPEAELRTAAALSGLDGVVAGLPDGWQTRVGRDGTGLSAGQRQRVAVTRALLRDVPLVVLDEPTAHLDAGAESVLLDAVSTLRRQGRTVLLVAHRPALVALADRVVAVTADTVGGQAAGQVEADLVGAS